MTEEEKIAREIVEHHKKWIPDETVDCVSVRISLICEIETALKAYGDKREEAIRNIDKDGPCYYCGKETNSYAGNPTLWPIRLCHSDDPGKVKPHHVGCVQKRLIGFKAGAEAMRDAALELVTDGEFPRSLADEIRAINLESSSENKK